MDAAGREPGDHSVPAARRPYVGFDDIDNAHWCCPPLTTVRQPLAEVGATAAGMVLAMVAGDPLPQLRVELATTLVVRGSTARPNRA